MAKEVPSPSPSEMLDALNDPIAHRQRSIAFDRGVQQLRPAPLPGTPHKGVPAPSDLVTELNKKGK